MKPPPGALNAYRTPAPRSDLRGLSLADVAGELLARLSAGHTFTSNPDLVLASQLQDVLDATADVHLNRFSRRRLYDVVRPVLDVVPPAKLRGATIVDLGSGSLNPFAFGFVFLMMGASRAYSVDLEPVQDEARAIRALAQTAAWVLVNPDYVIGPHTIDTHAMIDNLAGFNLVALAAGQAQGIAARRLTYQLRSVYDLALADNEADVVSSVSLLEHVERIDAALESLRRITKPGGVGHHIVDFIDHRVYSGEASDPLEFLTVKSAAPFVHGCNRLRCAQLCRLFEVYGFDVESIDPSRVEPVSLERRNRFVEPYRSMSPEQLSILCARIVVRRRG